ncbi:oxygen-insensitive NAD(P)H nitroreductase [Limibacter armeniacum]|uniref:oxygen-insensitive NAD(P)H nitroreductase n=1 Tax=Limibacter armeniacum TaxID=466084 RepID=UPI002FE54E25
MNILETLNWRYSTKEFDPNKKISEKDFEVVKALLRLSPSSTNIQPWHFVIADTQEGKARIAKSAHGFYQFNEPKIMDASYSVVFCARTSADEEYMHRLLDKEDKDGRFADPKFKEMMYGGRKIFADMHHYDYKDFQHWIEKQVYLNMGNFLLGVAAMGIDALPMEGVDLKVLDEEFGLREKGFTALAVVSIGYRKDSDFNAILPKSRLPEEEIFTVLS